MTEEVVEHDAAAEEFRIAAGNLTCVLQYRRQDGVITFLHTGVPEALRHRGRAGRLVAAGLEFARAERLAVVAACSYVAWYIGQHPEYQDLVRS